MWARSCSSRARNRHQPRNSERELWFDGDLLVRTKVIGSDNSVVLTDLR